MRSPIYKAYKYPSRCFSRCVYCGKEKLIKNMYGVYLKRDNVGSMRRVFHACPDCLQARLIELKVDMPTWED